MLNDAIWKMNMDASQQEKVAILAQNYLDYATIQTNIVHKIHLTRQCKKQGSICLISPARLCVNFTASKIIDNPTLPRRTPILDRAIVFANETSYTVENVFGLSVEVFQ